MRPKLSEVLSRNCLLAWVICVGLLCCGSLNAAAQDQDDPPGRVARLAYIEGSVSFQPAGESEWVDAVPNRPMTTGDKLWADRDSRAEVQLGSAMIDLAPNTGFSFLNLDDRTIQIQLSAGKLNVRVWELDRDNVFEIDTPNQAFSVYQPGRYRVESSENGDYTVVTIREGEGESTGNGQSYTMHSGQRFTFRGTTSLDAEVDQIGPSDPFDDWSYRRERRYEDSPSARYCSRRVVGFEDLDDYGDWRPNPEYGYVWFPRVEGGWAPYHEGHWAWIDPWGWTWVDDDRWGYAPFHYGRWASFDGRWGWVPGPPEVRPVYAPALVAFVGGGFAVGATVAWFPLAPREVYVPSYRVSPAYVNRVNVSNTTINQTTITNVYNTTIVNNNTTINNVTYANRNVQGAVTAVPQHAFATAQPVARAAVPVNARQLAAGPVMSRAAVPPAQQAVLGARANTANQVPAPPQALFSRPVTAKATPPPPLPPFSARQATLQRNPGVSVPRPELAKMRPANNPSTPVVRQAPPARPTTPTPAMNRPGTPPANQPGTPPNQPATNRPGTPPPNQPTAPPAGNTRPFTPPGRPQPATPPAAANPAQPSAPPTRTERPPSEQPNYRPQPTTPPNNRPEATPNPPNRPTEPPTRTERPPSEQPNYRPQPTTPPNNRPEATPPSPNRPPEPPSRTERPQPTPPSSNRPEGAPPVPNRVEPPPPRPDQPTSQPNRPQPTVPQQNRPEQNRPEQNRPEQNRPAPPTEPNRAAPPPRTDRPPAAQQRPEPKQTPDQKKREEEQKKQQEKPQ